MTQEDKELLMKDLCARLPYSTRIHITHPSNNDAELDDWLTIGTIDNLSWFGSVKPYLRPMSSMTEEEEDKWLSYIINPLLESVNNPQTKSSEFLLKAKSGYDSIDWLNALHFDYRGLIEKGLAIEAPEDMYKRKK